MTMVTHIARVRINRVRSPILLVVSRAGKINISLSPFAPENLVSRDGFGSPVRLIFLLTPPITNGTIHQIQPEYGDEQADAGRDG